METNEGDFGAIIETSFTPVVIDGGTNWHLVQHTESIYDVIFRSYDTETQLEAGLTLVKLGLGTQFASYMGAYRLTDGTVRVTVVKK